jgi:magnesium chelatase subunit D
VDDERLLGGLDLSASLAQGQTVWQRGLLSQADQGLVVLPMAERWDPGVLARILQAQERTLTESPARFGVVALDESLDDDKTLRSAVTERLGLWIDLREVSWREDIFTDFDAADLAYARQHWTRLALSEPQWRALCHTAQTLGVDSLRAPQIAARLACILAALQRRPAVEHQDLVQATQWVIAPRATVLPAPDPAPETDAADNPPQEPSDASPHQEDSASQAADLPPLEDLVLEATLAALPDQLLDRLKLNAMAARTARSQGAQGVQRHSGLRGRPLPPRPGKPRQGARLHVLATLRAAIPRQKLRTKPQHGTRLALRVDDFHCHRYAQHTSTCLIFAVDASGSAALQRLAEAKGAVELLLNQAYARRDQVCVLAFRAGQAQVLLPPTRSLVRAKRALAGLPAGGGTPLASGLQLALSLALQQARDGVTPLLVVLSDGRANVNLQGIGGREQAQADAKAVALACAQHRLTSLWLDTSAQPDPLARQWAELMQARYLPMPLAQSARMADAMRQVVHDLSV